MLTMRKLITILALSLAASLPAVAQVTMSGSTVVSGGVPAQQFLGAWSSSTSYGLNAIVTYSGSNYISLIAGNLNNTPSSSPTDWAVFSGGGGGGSLTPSSVAYPHVFYPSAGSTGSPAYNTQYNATYVQNHQCEGKGDDKV